MCVCKAFVSTTYHSDSVFLPLSGCNRQLTGGDVDHYLVPLGLGELLFDGQLRGGDVDHHPVLLELNELLSVRGPNELLAWLENCTRALSTAFVATELLDDGPHRVFSARANRFSGQES
jgi:hypothetical protein